MKKVGRNMNRRDNSNNNNNNSSNNIKNKMPISIRTHMNKAKIETMTELNTKHMRIIKNFKQEILILGFCFTFSFFFLEFFFLLLVIW
jgi:hypothetical protein